jgi:hypothetical protein
VDHKYSAPESTECYLREIHVILVSPWRSPNVPFQRGNGRAILEVPLIDQMPILLIQGTVPYNFLSPHGISITLTDAVPIQGHAMYSIHKFLVDRHNRRAMLRWNWEFEHSMNHPLNSMAWHTIKSFQVKSLLCRGPKIMVGRRGLRCVLSELWEFDMGKVGGASQREVTQGSRTPTNPIKVRREISPIATKLYGGLGSWSICILGSECAVHAPLHLAERVPTSTPGQGNSMQWIKCR